MLSVGTDELIITTTDQVIVFPELVGAHQLPITSGESNFLHEKGNPWVDACIFRTKDSMGALELMKCGFGEEAQSKTLYAWLAGRCSFDTPVRFIHNTGPSAVLTEHARRVYFEYRHSGLPCRKASIPPL